jgi:hypothetical protein
MINGRDVIIPGVLNRFYVHFLSRILPPVAIGAMSQFCWHMSTTRSKGDKLKSIPAAITDKDNEYYDNDVLGEEDSMHDTNGDDYSEGRPTEGHEEKSRRQSKDEKDGSGLLQSNKIYKKLEKGVKAWAMRFWYSPVIDYAAIRAWLSYPFQKKGMEIEITDEDIDAAVAAGMDRGDRDDDTNDVDQASDILDEEDTPTSGEMQKWQVLRLKEMMRRMKRIITEKEEQTQMKPNEPDTHNNEEREATEGEHESEENSQVDDARDSGDDQEHDNYFRSDFHAREQARLTQRDSFFKDFFNNNDQQKNRDDAKQ